MFEKHYKELKKRGIKVGAYHYSYATSIDNAKKEIDNCLKIIKNKHFELPIFYDLEDETVKKLGKNNITLIAKEFCKKISKNGYRAGVYANLNWFKNYIDVDKIKEYNIWLAQWEMSKHTADFRVDYWQYTSKGKVGGISGNVDMNMSYVDKIVDNVENNVDKTPFNYFKKGKNYKTQVVLNVRKAPSINGSKKSYNELTENAKKHAYRFGVNKGCLKKNTEVSVLNIKQIKDDVWLLIPSRMDSRIL